MSKIVTDSQNYSDIADAIRAKGVSGTFKPNEMADAIESISSGGAEITDGIVVKARDANGSIESIVVYGNTGQYEIGASTMFDTWTYGKLKTIELSDNCLTAAYRAFAMLPHLETFIGNNLSSIGIEIFRNCCNLKTLMLPKLITMEGYFNFAYCSRLETCQIGSIGYQAPTSDRPFYDCTQAGLTITAYSSGARADAVLANYRNNATGATIIIKASENTTYGGNSYLAGETMITSTP